MVEKDKEMEDEIDKDLRMMEKEKIKEKIKKMKGILDYKVRRDGEKRRFGE